jgi:hypothetical protein
MSSRRDSIGNLFGGGVKDFERLVMNLFPSLDVSGLPEQHAYDVSFSVKQKMG